MGKMNAADAADLARAAEGALGALNAVVGPFLLEGQGNVTIRIGTLSGVVVLERSFDGTATWDACTAGGSQVVFGSSVSEVIEEPEPGVWYRLRVASYTSGAGWGRLSGPR